jgi:hypothetical protein
LEAELEVYEDDTSSLSSSNINNTEGKVTEEQKSLYSEIVKMTKSEGRKHEFDRQTTQTFIK